MPAIPLRATAFGLLLGALVAALIFRGFPEIDLAISAFFWREDEGFLLTDNRFFGGLRRLLWGAAAIVALGSWAALIASSLLRRPVLGLPARYWGFTALLFLLGPVLIADTLLKMLFGRPRPASIEAFGGTLDFAPALEISRACTQNCSFVSGEVAGVSALAIALLLALWVHRRALPSALRCGFGAVLCALPALSALQRIGSGRHFLSDTVFAFLVVAAIALALYAALLAPARTRSP